MEELPVSEVGIATGEFGLTGLYLLLDVVDRDILIEERSVSKDKFCFVDVISEIYLGVFLGCFVGFLVNGLDNPLEGFCLAVQFLSHYFIGVRMYFPCIVALLANVRALAMFFLMGVVFFLGDNQCSYNCYIIGGVTRLSPNASRVIRFVKIDFLLFVFAH